MRMNRHMRMACLLCLLLLPSVCGCSWLINKTAGFFQKKPSATTPVGEVRLIGVVELVNPEQNYVLINCEQRLNIAAGTEIIAQNPDGSRAKLKVSPERKGTYITADILEGTPQLQDLVLHPNAAANPSSPNLQPRAPTAPPTIGNQTSLVPIMQPDVIPPLGTPFEPSASSSVPPPTQRPAPAPRPETDAPSSEAGLNALPPAIR